jgi:predicted transcriptional regulator of viral defense system
MKVIKNDNYQVNNIIKVPAYQGSMISETFEMVRSLDAFPVFTLDDFASLIHKDTSYSKIVLNRLLKRGLIERVQRDRYTTHKDPLIVSTNIAHPSYISLWYALNYYHLTEQIPSEISVLTTLRRSVNRISFHGAQITFTRIPSIYLFGYGKTSIGGFEVFIAEKEKAILDSVLLKRVSLSEIIEILSTNESDLNVDKLVEYTIQAGNIPALKRIGWILELKNYSEAQRLKPYAKGSIIPLDYSAHMVGERDRSWGIVINRRDER